MQSYIRYRNIPSYLAVNYSVIRHNTVEVRVISNRDTTRPLSLRVQDHGLSGKIMYVYRMTISCELHKLLHDRRTNGMFQTEFKMVMRDLFTWAAKFLRKLSFL